MEKKIEFEYKELYKSSNLGFQIVVQRQDNEVI